MQRPSLPQWLRRPYVIETTDPDGVRIICSQSHWSLHISSLHLEMKGQAQVAALVIKSPEFIHQDATHPNRKVYYRRGILPAPLDKGLLKIVVEYPRINIGTIRPAHVVTAYVVEAPKKGEQLIWPSPDQPRLL